MPKYKKNTRPDHSGIEQGIFKHNKAILRKTATICALCGMPIDKSLKYPDPMSITIDHIIPVYHGGKSTLDNLQAAHWICNRQKGTKIIGNEAKIIKKETLIPQYIDWSNYQEK